jgi:SAM-dependent methyltransferase
MPIWYEDEEFWETSVGWMLRARVDAAASDVDKVLALTGISPPGEVLDLGCGIGRHSLELARRGFRVTGVDRTRPFLEEARRSAEAEGLGLELVEQDMRRFRRADGFDLAVNLLTTFGYFEDPDDDRRVALNLFESLRPGGVALLDMMGKENLARIFNPREWMERDGEIWLYERKLERSWSWLENRWIVIKDGERKEFRLSHRLYSAAELTRLLRECGFASVDAYGDLAGAPYDQVASRLVVVGRKD